MVVIALVQILVLENVVMLVHHHVDQTVVGLVLDALTYVKVDAVQNVHQLVLVVVLDVLDVVVHVDQIVLVLVAQDVILDVQEDVTDNVLVTVKVAVVVFVNLVVTQTVVVNVL